MTRNVKYLTNDYGNKKNVVQFSFNENDNEVT